MDPWQNPLVLGNKEQDAKRMKNIICNHLLTSVIFQVNIDAETRFQLQESLKTITKTSFAKAQQQIFLLMASDSFKRFQTQEAEKCQCSNNNNNNNLSSAVVSAYR